VQIFVVDVAGGDKVPRKGGPGVTFSDLLVVNKTDLAPLVGADLGVMERDARKMRGAGPFLFTQVTNGVGVDGVIEGVLSALSVALGAPPPSAARCARPASGRLLLSSNGMATRGLPVTVP